MFSVQRPKKESASPIILLYLIITVGSNGKSVAITINIFMFSLVSPYYRSGSKIIISTKTVLLMVYRNVFTEINSTDTLN